MTSGIQTQRKDGKRTAPALQGLSIHLHQQDSRPLALKPANVRYSVSAVLSMFCDEKDFQPGLFLTTGIMDGRSSVGFDRRQPNEKSIFWRGFIPCERQLQTESFFLFPTPFSSPRAAHGRLTALGRIRGLLLRIRADINSGGWVHQIPLGLISMID
jgi:hypothetical protein